MNDETQLLIVTAAQVYGPIATASIAHSKPATVREQSIQACVDDSILVARKIIAAARAATAARDGLAARRQLQEEERNGETLTP